MIEKDGAAPSSITATKAADSEDRSEDNRMAWSQLFPFASSASGGICIYQFTSFALIQDKNQIAQNIESTKCGFACYFRNI